MHFILKVLPEHGASVTMIVLLAQPSPYASTRISGAVGCGLRDSSSGSMPWTIAALSGALPLGTGT